MRSTPSLSEYRWYVGVDIAAASVTVIRTTDGRMQPKAVAFSQSASDFAAFQQQLQAHPGAPAQTLIVLEATGSSWIARAVTLHEAGYAVAVLNPCGGSHIRSGVPRPNRRFFDALASDCACSR